MYIFKKTADIQQYLQRLRSEGNIIGFAPTMGALHAGHVSLIQAAKQRGNTTVSSIFVNPTQFDNKTDLDKYPRTLDTDIQLLEAAGCDILFAPDVSEVYPPDLQTNLSIDLQGMDNRLEGSFRPGHFQGMIQVVKRLLDIVQPQYLYMGQKDFQQQRIVQHMITQLQLPVQLVRCPIIREPDGLAMSSRNVHLKPDERLLAPTLSKVLFEARSNAPTTTLQTVKQQAITALQQIPQLTLDYLEVIDGNTLQPLNEWTDSDFIVICTTVRLGFIRLLDNVIVKEHGNWCQ